jgi:hypothetical protein
MTYLCFASRTNGDIKPATRVLLFVTDSLTQYNINLGLVRPRYKNYRFECVKIRHDGQFHLELESTQEPGE